MCPCRGCSKPEIVPIIKAICRWIIICLAEDSGSKQLHFDCVRQPDDFISFIPLRIPALRLLKDLGSSTPILSAQASPKLLETSGYRLSSTDIKLLSQDNTEHEAENDVF